MRIKGISLFTKNQGPLDKSFTVYLSNKASELLTQEFKRKFGFSPNLYQEEQEDNILIDNIVIFK